MPLSTEELGRLQLRITADGEQYLKVLKDIQKETEKTHHAMGKMAEKAAEFTREVGTDVANRLLGGLGFGGLAGGLATGIVKLFENATEVAERYERAEISLTSVLETNGRAVGRTRHEYEMFASEMDRTTTLTKLQTLQLLRMAESHRLTGDAAKAAVREAAALSATTGHDPQALLRVTAAVEEGNIKQAMSYGRLIPELRGYRNEEEFLIELQKQVAAGQDIQSQLVDTSAEKWKKAREELDHYEVGLGRVVNKMGENILQMAKWGARKSGSPLLGILGELGEHPHPTVEINEMARETLALDAMDKARARARERLATAGAKDLKDWIADLKEDVKYANLASEAEKRLAKDRDRGAGATPAGAAALEEARDLLRQISGEQSEAKARKSMEAMRDKVYWQEKATAAKREHNFLYDEELEKLARLVPFGDAYVEFLRKIREGHKAQEIAAKALTEIETPEERLRDRIKELDFALKAGELKWDQYARAVEAARNKILGAMAALQSANSVFSGADAGRRFADYFVPNRSDGTYPERGAARAGPGANAEAALDAGSRVRNPGMDPFDNPAGRAKLGEAQAAAVTILEQMLALMQGGVQLAVVGAD